MMKFVKPDPVSVSYAADVPLPDDTRITITDTPSAKGYPMSSFTWILVYKEQAYSKRPIGRAEALANLLWWMTHEGQQYAEPLHYAPLPDEAARKAEKIIKSITYDGRPILQ